MSQPSPRNSRNNPFEDDWEEGPREQAVEPFIRQVRGKAPTPERNVKSVVDSPELTPKAAEPKNDQEDFTPPLPKSAPPARTPMSQPQAAHPESSTPTLDGVMSSIGLGNSSPLVSARKLDCGPDTPTLSARLVPSQQSHRKVEVRIASPKLTH